MAMNLTGNKTTFIRNHSSNEPSRFLWYESGYNIILIVILILSVFGETLLLIQLGRARKRKNILRTFTAHMALMDLILVMSAIPDYLVFEVYQSWKFGEIGCQLLYPIETFAYTSKVLTLLAIAYLTWFGITSKIMLAHSKHKVNVLLLVVNVTSISAVIPYFVTLVYVRNQSTGKATCNEKWSLAHRKIYTLVLFLLQYGIPAPLMVMFYYLSWRRIFESNKNLTKHSNRSSVDSNRLTALREDHEIHNGTLEMKRLSIDSVKGMVSRMFSKGSETSLFDELDVKNKSRKSLHRNIMNTSFQGKVLVLRHMQYKRLAKTFTLIVLVFLIFTLPNQLLWLYIDFFNDGNMSFNQNITSISHILTYANCVLNPWIYGQWYRKIKHYCSFLLCFGKKEVDNEIVLEPCISQ